MSPHSCCNKQKVKRGLWSPEEDEKLINYISTYGHGCWSSVPRLAGLQRCGKSCRLRWINYLRPDLKRGSFSPQEAAQIIELHRILGNRQYFGRTDNEVKNFWNSTIKKKLIASQELFISDHHLHQSSIFLDSSKSLLSGNFFSPPNPNPNPTWLAPQLDQTTFFANQPQQQLPYFSNQVPFSNFLLSNCEPTIWSPTLQHDNSNYSNYQIYGSEGMVIPHPNLPALGDENEGVVISNVVDDDDQRKMMLMMMMDMPIQSHEAVNYSIIHDDDDDAINDKLTELEYPNVEAEHLSPSLLSSSSSSSLLPCDHGANFINSAANSTASTLLLAAGMAEFGN
ncbi:hypothetical protein V2J09_005859 [Rumex salicifolius]